MRTGRIDVWIGVAIATIVVALPWMRPAESLINLITLIMVWAIFAVGFDFAFGSLGMVSFGHASFLGIGAYASAFALQRWGLPFGAGVVLAFVAAGMCAWAFSFFALRVSGIFFALVTLALAQLLYILADSKLRLWTGGTDGIPGINRPTFAGIDFYEPLNYYWYVALAFSAVLAAVGVVRCSPFGRVISGIRQNETRALQLGFDVHRYKQITFVVSGAISGLSGALLASFLFYVNPQMLHWTTSGDVIIMTLLGGSGTLWGPVVGVFLFEVLKEVLSAWTQHWYGILGFIFILTTLLLPRGVVGEVQAQFRALRVRKAPQESRHDRSQ